MKKLNNKFIYIGLFLCLAFLSAAMVTAEINNSTNSSNNNSTNEFNDLGNLTNLIKPSNFINPMNFNLSIITADFNPSDFKDLLANINDINDNPQMFENGAVIDLNLNGNYIYTETLNITSNVTVTINGNGATLNGSNQFKILQVTNGSLNINNATITNGEGDDGGGAGILFSNSNNNTVSDCNLTNNIAHSKIQGEGGAGILFRNSSNNTVSGCNLINNTAGFVGGGISFGNSSNNIVSDCNLINNTAGGNNMGGGGICITQKSYADDSGTNDGISVDNLIIYNRFYNNDADAGGLDFTTDNETNNFSCNWWGNNNPTITPKGAKTPNQIMMPNGGIYDNHFVVRLSENDTNKTTSSDNVTVDILASYGDVTLTYELVLNDTNSSVETPKLPNFTASHYVTTANKIVEQHTVSLLGSLKKFLNGLFEWVNADGPFNAKETYTTPPQKLPYNNEILSFENIVDDEDLVLNITSSDNYPPIPTNLTLNSSSDNITFGDNITLTANLTNNSSEPIPNANITFIINGINEINRTTFSNGTAILGISYLPAGEYNVTAIYNGNESYNASNSSTTFNVAKKDISLNITKVSNITSPIVVGDLVKYTITITNNGSTNITTPILINDLLNSNLEYISSDDNNYNHGTGVWNITPSLNVGDTKTLNIIAKVKTAGKVINTASLNNANYNNSLDNSSSVDISVNPAPNPPGPDPDDTGNGTVPGSNDNGGFPGFGNGLRDTGFPLIILLVLSVTGVLYWRRK
jgi:uncharacterized repeat protein (TIGR01451 family)